MRCKTGVVVFLALFSASSVAAQPAGLLLRAEGDIETTCHAAPTVVRGEACQGGWCLFATDAGAVLQDKEGRSRTISTCSGLPSNRVSAVASAGVGEWLVASHTGGIVRLAIDDEGNVVSVEVLPGTEHSIATAVDSGREGVWFGTSDRGLWLWNEGRVSQPIAAFDDGLITALLAIPQKSGDLVYAARGRRGLWAARTDGSKARRLLRRRYVQELREEGKSIVAVSPSALCRIPVGSTKRARCEAPDLRLPSERVEELDLPPAPVSPHVTAMAVHQGRLWVGTFQHGLSTFDGERWRQVDISAAPSVMAYVNDLEVYGETLWLAGPHGAARHDKHGWRVFGAEDGLPEGHVNAVLPTKSAVWFGCSKGLLRLDERGPTLFTTAHGLPGRIVYDVGRDSHGRILVATNRGAARFDGRRFESWSHESGELSDNWAQGVAEWECEIWVGSYDAGIDRGDPTGRWEPDPGEPLWVNPGGLFPFDRVLAVATLGDGLWARAVDGAWYAWTKSSLLPDPDVTCVAEYGDQLWIGTRAGLVSWSEAVR